MFDDSVDDPDDVVFTEVKETFDTEEAEEDDEPGGENPGGAEVGEGGSKE